MLKKLLRSKILFGVYLVIIVFGICELATRVYFALEISPRVLFYGTAWYRNVAPDKHEQRRQRTLEDPEVRRAFDKQVKVEAREDSVEHHLNEGRGYSKFFPHEQKTTRDVDTGERIPTTINASGFRGPDFKVDKAPGVVRVLTLGASSTFGFYNRDEDTYPHQLQGILNASCPQQRFEVINLGVPHSSSDMIAALYEAEGSALKPDVITFYEGRNDSVANDSYGLTFWQKAYAVLLHRLMLVAFIDQTLVGTRLSVAEASQKFEPFAAKRSHFFLSNLSRLLEASRNDGARLIVMSQQALASPGHPLPEAERLPRRGITLSQEADAIRRKQSAGKDLFSFEYALLIHERLMKDEKRWAEANGVTFVDAVAALDQHRDLMLSWAHLNPKANRILAELLAQPILKDFCPASVNAALPAAP